MNKTPLIVAACASLAFTYAIAVSHVPVSDSVACGDSDTKKKKSDNKEDEKA